MPAGQHHHKRCCKKNCSWMQHTCIGKDTFNERCLAKCKAPHSNNTQTKQGNCGRCSCLTSESSCPRLPDYAFFAKIGSGQDVCFGPSRPDPGRNTREQDGTRTGRDARPGWVRNAVKQSTWRMWMGLLRSRDGTWTGPGSEWHPKRQ